MNSRRRATEGGLSCGAAQQHRTSVIERAAEGAPLRDCIFCRIAAGEIPAEIVAEDDDFVAFRDVRPLAPVHLLVIPKSHVASLDEAEALDDDATARALGFIAATARAAGVAGSGYRVITNTGPDAGQEVMHLHWHVVGGARLGGMV
jgi:histidine triad (HIT) family protein